MMTTKRIMKIGILYLLLIAYHHTLFAQQEIPDVIKDKIVNGIKYLENSKVPADMDKAVKEFAEAAKIAPDFPDVHYYLGKTLSMMQGCAGKAVWELKKYLELYPDAPDKEKVSAEIAELEVVLKSKNNSYLMGISLIELSDGIYVSKVSPNYPLDRFTGRGGVPIKAGDKIDKINGTSLKGYSIQDILKLIEKDTAKTVYHEITIIRGGKTIQMPMLRTKKITDPLIKDLGEEDLATILKESKIPVVVFFASNWCDSCEKYISPLKIKAYSQKDSVAFVNVNIDENIYTAQEFNITKVPAIYMYKEGVLVDKIVGYDYKLYSKKMEAFLK